MQKKQKQSNVISSLATASTIFLVLCLIMILVNGKPKHNTVEQIHENVSVTEDVQPEDIKVVTEVDKKSLKCLEKALYFEVRKNNPFEMEVVGNVIINRVKHKLYPNNICDVILQKVQFSYVNDGLHSEKAVKETTSLNILEKQSWKTAQEVAYKFLTEDVEDYTGGAIAYHANDIEKPDSPFWRKLVKTKKFGLHTFYTLNNK